MNTVAEKVLAEFHSRFTTEPSLYYSPGRINLIGEHVDYNDGYVMPAAIDKGVWYALANNNSNELKFYSIDFTEALTVKLSQVKKMEGWKNYVLSVVNEFIIRGLPVQGFDCVFGGNIADGAGMSSSAAVEGGLAFGINEIFNCGIPKTDLATLCQQAEHNYPGVNCGIMDQFANMMGKKDHVILLDTMSLKYEYFPLVLDGLSIILINTRVHHSLATSEYNKRRSECEEGLKLLKKQEGIKSFRDVNIEILTAFKDKMSLTIYNRCLFIIEEIARTKKAAIMLRNNDLANFGKLMYEAHEGLSELYEVSCNELDFLVALAREDKNVLGARMMGGGFGGCTINIIRTEDVETFLKTSTTAYISRFNIQPEVFRVGIADGTHKIVI